MKSSITNDRQDLEKPSAIKVDNVSFSWSAQTQVLQSCSLEVPQGEFWMLLGNNGSGKSTLLKLLTGLLIPDSGTATIANTFGLVFQNPDLQLVMPTVAADIAFGLVAENLSASEVRERVRTALAAVNLLDLERRPIYALSGGQKQRIAIAGALARNCATILFDEPTALLDSDTQIELVEQVQNLVKTQGITALWVTHRLEELDYCDGAFLLENGQVTAQGAPKTMKNKLLQKQYQDL